MRNKILGTIGVLWGGSIIVSGFIRGLPDSSGGGYAAGQFAGQFAGYAIGLLMLVAGLYALFNKSPS